MEDTKNNRFTFTCGSLMSGAMLSTGIILARALQANSIPMHLWSVKSWIWMTSPVWLQIAFAGVVGFFALALMIWQDIRR